MLDHLEILQSSPGSLRVGGRPRPR
jgi:hypothetical protein